MSAILSASQVPSVISDLELLQDIRRALSDLHDSDVSTEDRVTVSISTREGGRDMPICFVHGGTSWLAGVALRAMEREVSGRLASKDITVEDVA